MRLSVLAFSSTLALALPLAVGATGSTNDPLAQEPIRWEDFDDPAFDPTLPRAALGVSVAPTSAISAQTMSPRAAAIAIGPLGVDDGGARGRVHTVTPGETLWDISDAYLGTPWVWPSVWSENEGIDDPHVIEPGDQIWITASEMRRVTPLEAEELVSQAIDVQIEDPAEEMVVAAFGGAPEDDGPMEEPLPEESAPDELPSLEPMAGSVETGQMLRIPPQQPASIVTADVIAASSTIVDGPTIRVMMTQGDEAYIGLGEGEVSIGDEFSIFRNTVPIRDPETSALLGYHIDEIGWLRVDSLDGEWSTATIVEATDEMQRGDKIIPRLRMQTEVSVRMGDPETVGLIALTPGYRAMAGSTDSVYVNLGSIHGMELGTKLEVYSGTGEELDLPGAVMAEMVIIKVEPEVSAAYITLARRELQVGDEVRGPTLRRAQQAAYDAR